MASAEMHKRGNDLPLVSTRSRRLVDPLRLGVKNKGGSWLSARSAPKPIDCNILSEHHNNDLNCFIPLWPLSAL